MHDVKSVPKGTLRCTKLYVQNAIKSAELLSYVRFRRKMRFSHNETILARKGAPDGHFLAWIPRSGGRPNTSCGGFAVSHPFAQNVFSPMTSFTQCPGTSFTLPCVLRTRGSVKDVSGRNVKDVLGLDTQNAKGWGARPLRQKQPTIAPLDLPFQCCHIVTRKAAATDTMNPVIPTRMSDFPLQSFC